MKQIVALVLTIAAGHFVSADETKMLTQSAQDLGAFITNVSTQFEVRRLSKADQIIEYAASNKFSKADLVRIARDLADDSARRVNEGGDPKKLAKEIMKCNCAFSVLAKMEDHSVLDFLEQKSTHSNELIRVDSSVAYVRIAGIDAISFIERKRSDVRFSELDLCKLFDFFRIRIAKGKDNNNNCAVNKALHYLLTTLETENNGEIACRLDKMLSEFLADYKESLQRFQVMERLTKHENAYYRNVFEAKLLEIEKTPKEKRRDFKAKGELLGSDRLK